jgi:hypothetical protein
VGAGNAQVAALAAAALARARGKRVEAGEVVEGEGAAEGTESA